jgi:hypothetical protein
MANYIGNQPSYGEFKRLDSISSSFDGSTTTFNLAYNSVSHSVGDASQLIVSLNGIVQEPLNSYTLGVGGSSIVFAAAPASGDTCFIMYIGGAGGTVTTISDGVVTASKLDASLKDYYEDEFTADGSTTDFTLSRESVGVNQLLVSIDGIVQPTSAYTASGTTFTVSPALPNGTNIRVVHMGVKAGVFVPQAGSVGLNELDLTGVDTRYYTQTAADSTFETISNVALKAPIANPSFTGNVDVNGTITTQGLNFDVADGVEINVLESLIIDIDSDNNQTSRVFQVKTNDTDPLLTLYDSGNLLVGKAVTTFNVEGFNYENGKALELTTDSDRVLRLNRTTNDGDIAQFNKDGITVGSIGAKSDDLYIGTGDTGIRFNDGNDQLWPVAASGTSRDAAISLGNSGVRFKDLYLSGGVYLGGTTDVNKLDDYEEGTWTPSFSSTAVTVTVPLEGTYTKIGRVVYWRVTGKCQRTGDSTSQVTINGLPFSVVESGVASTTYFEITPWLPTVLSPYVSGTSIYFTRPTGTSVIYQGYNGDTYNNRGTALQYNNITTSTNINLQGFEVYGYYIANN